MRLQSFTFIWLVDVLLKLFQMFDDYAYIWTVKVSTDLSDMVHSIFHGLGFSHPNRCCKAYNLATEYMTSFSASMRPANKT